MLRSRAALQAEQKEKRKGIRDSEFFQPQSHRNYSKSLFKSLDLENYTESSENSNTVDQASGNTLRRQSNVSRLACFMNGSPEMNEDSARFTTVINADNNKCDRCIIDDDDITCCSGQLNFTKLPHARYNSQIKGLHTHPSQLIDCSHAQIIENPPLCRRSIISTCRCHRLHPFVSSLSSINQSIDGVTLQPVDLEHQQPYLSSTDSVNNQKQQYIAQEAVIQDSQSSDGYDNSTKELTKYCILLGETSDKPNDNKSASEHKDQELDLKGWNNMDWKDIARRYREMPRQHRGQFWWRLRSSCFCHVLTSTLNSFFPILTAFKDYSFPKDLLIDLMAGFTIAVLHIPQGMAYGMLSGVEPIYGLYVSFVPVLIMAFMSKSSHVSYGTFAVISMVMMNSIEGVKETLAKQMEAARNQRKILEPLAMGNNEPAPGLVLTNNHQPTDPSQSLLRNLLTEPLLNINNVSGQPDLTGPLSNSLTSSFSTFQLQANFVMPSNIEILSSICLITGIIQIFMSIAQLGLLSLMFSDQLVSGFTTASAVNVVTSQIAGVFDMNLPKVPEGLFRIFRTWWQFAECLLEGFNQNTAILSLVSIIFLLSIKEIIEPKLKRRFKGLICLPSELALMSSLIFASWYWGFEKNYNIRTIGHIPTGLPAPKPPRLDFVPLIIQDSITVALVSFVMNLSLAQIYAKRFRYTLDPNQELFAIGTSNFVSSFFTCYPCASSLSRSAVQSNLNVKSPLCSLFSSAIVVLTICYFAPILYDLPRSTLSCIIIVALKGILIQIKDLFENWRLSKLDALVWIVTFMSVIIFGITHGLIIGILSSLFMVFFRFVICSE